MMGHRLSGLLKMMKENSFLGIHVGFVSAGLAGAEAGRDGRTGRAHGHRWPDPELGGPSLTYLPQSDIMVTR